MKKLLINILIIAVIIIAIIFTQHKYFSNSVGTTTTVRDTIWKDTTIIEYKPKFYPIYRDTGSIKVIKIPADSASITEAYIKLHKDFYASYFYSDTIKNDSCAFVQVDAEITQNKPVNYTLTYFDRTPSVINNTTNIYSQNEFYIGIEASGNKIAPSLLFKSKNNYIFGVEYNLIKSDIAGNRFEIKGYIDVNKIKLW